MSASLLDSSPPLIITLGTPRRPGGGEEIGEPGKRRAKLVAWEKEMGSPPDGTTGAISKGRSLTFPVPKPPARSALLIHGERIWEKWNSTLWPA